MAGDREGAVCYTGRSLPREIVEMALLEIFKCRLVILKGSPSPVDLELGRHRQRPLCHGRRGTPERVDAAPSTLISTGKGAVGLLPGSVRYPRLWERAGFEGEGQAHFRLCPVKYRALPDIRLLIRQRGQSFRLHPQGGQAATKALPRVGSLRSGF